MNELIGAAVLSNDVLEMRDLNDYIVAEVKTFEEHFGRRLEEAKEEGTLPADFDVGAASGVLVTFLQGLRL